MCVGGCGRGREKVKMVKGLGEEGGRGGGKPLIKD